jgi:hypothetical protein
MNYKIISVEGFDGVTYNHVLIDNGDETFVSFPANNLNPNFVAFIEANPNAMLSV